MDRSEKIGLGVAVVGHAVLFGLLSLGFLSAPEPPKIQQQPIDVSLVPDVALEATAPQATEVPAQSIAPDEGAPEDAAPPAPDQAEPEPKPDPVPPAPQPRPTPPKPKPQPAPEPKPEPKPQPKPKPAPPKPAAKPAPVKKPVEKPKPAPAKAKPTKASPEKSAPAKTTTKAKDSPAKSSSSSSKSAKPSSTKGSGSTAEAKTSRPRGSRLGDNFLKGLSADPSPSKSEAPRAAKMDAKAATNIGSAILRQVQPCANRQVTPGPGAERIRVKINLRLNRDGSLAGRPTISEHTGVDEDNQRYVARVDDLAIATFVGCSPLRGLPDELYDVPHGWSNFSLRYKLPG
ncbi:cell envelope biogenesis protein TolA [Sphingomonas sp. M1A8_2b]